MALTWLSIIGASAHASCVVTAAGPDQLIITTSAVGTCDSGVMREALQSAILASDATSRARQAGMTQRTAARAGRNTNSALYRLGTAPSAVPPPTTFVMPGNAAAR